MKVNAKLCIVVILMCIVAMYAHDVGTHWYISLQTLDIWQDYDLDFYPSFYFKKSLRPCFLKLQYFQHMNMKHFSDTRYFVQHFSLVEAQEGCLCN